MTAQSEKITAFLKELDALVKTNKPYPLYLIGGAAITLAFDPQNRTADLDFIDPPEIMVKKGGPKSNLAKKYGVYVSPVAEINFSVPHDWKTKCTPLSLKLHHLEVLIPCIEDIIMGKLARLEPKDFEDIIALHEKKLLDPKKLIDRLKKNRKELKEPTYRNNVKLLFREVFRINLSYQKGDVVASRTR